MPDYKFYMSRKTGESSWESERDLEADFPGLKYKSCTGLSDYGKIKNIYTESFAEEDGISVYIPDNEIEPIARESTDIEFEFAFGGKDRRDVFHSFIDYITGHVIRFHDTARNREVEMILQDKVEIDDDLLIGSSPYIVVPIKFKNINGSTKKYE